VQDLLPQLVALAQVLLIDLTLAGDNAVMLGLVVAGLAPEQRRRAVLIGIIAATLIRVALAAVTVQLLAIIGLTLAGGLLLLWVCWKSFRELRAAPSVHAAPAGGVARKTMRQAIMQILVADVSMSLDNVLAVAGAAREHPWVMGLGLGLSVVMTGAVATMIARLLQNRPWIAWVGVLIVLAVALRMIWEGSEDVIRHLGYQWSR
jgi:YjbE family integral membrane protein